MWRALFALFLFCFVLPVNAVELSARASAFASGAKSEQGDVGYSWEDDTQSANQLSIRWMLGHSGEHSAWSLHAKQSYLYLNDASPFLGEAELAATDQFRYRALEDEAITNCHHSDCDGGGHVVDRAFYQYSMGDVSFTAGRQAIDWGSGRLWQPMNVFGAFSPLDLDTDYKPGIDALVLDWYPGDFSAASLVWVRGPQEHNQVDNSAAGYYRTPLGEQGELGLLAGSVAGNQVAGASLENSLAGIGWRLEAVRYRLEHSHRYQTFAIAGIDYQWENGTLMLLEWYEHSGGASRLSSVDRVLQQPLYQAGLQPWLGRHLLGLSVSRDWSALWNFSWNLFVSGIRNHKDHHNGSLLNQLNLVYSVSDESDLTFSLLKGTGKGLVWQGPVAGWLPRSEFGHLPVSASVRLRWYF